MMSFSCTVLVTWEGVLVYVKSKQGPFFPARIADYSGSLFATGFINGGTAGLVWQFLLVWGGTLSTFVTIGELASMAPTAGGQYHWVHMLSPKSTRNFLSYITGWMTVLAWVASIATGAFLSASMTQALCLINYPDYANVYAGWQGTLISSAFVLVCVFFNTVVGSLLPKVEGSFMMLHILGFFAILIPLVYYAPKATAAEVFSSATSYQNAGMWNSYGTSFLVGTLGAAFSFVGADAAVHVSIHECLDFMRGTNC
jgi:amino acid transporter